MSEICTPNHELTLNPLAPNQTPYYGPGMPPAAPTKTSEIHVKNARLAPAAPVRPDPVTESLDDPAILHLKTSIAAYRLQLEAMAATSDALRILTRLLNTCDNPTELRRAATIIVRLAIASSLPGLSCPPTFDPTPSPNGPSRTDPPRPPLANPNRLARIATIAGAAANTPANSSPTNPHPNTPPNSHHPTITESHHPSQSPPQSPNAAPSSAPSSPHEPKPDPRTQPSVPRSPVIPLAISAATLAACAGQAPPAPAHSATLPLSHSATSPSQPPDRPAPSLSLTFRGGLSGSPGSITIDNHQLTATYQGQTLTHTLTPDNLARLNRRINAIDWQKIPTYITVPLGSDLFTYTLERPDFPPVTLPQPIPDLRLARLVSYLFELAQAPPTWPTPNSS